MQYVKKDFTAEKLYLEDRLEFNKAEFSKLEERYDNIMEDFDKKCRE